MKGWLDNFGKADNANDSNVSVSEDFVGLGYNTKGRNYSPAWGGQFQKGGNLFPSQQILGGGQQSTIQPTIPYLTTKDPAEFYKSWIQSPEYEQRLKATGYSDLPDKWLDGKDVGGVDYTKQQRLDLLENIQPFEYDKYKKSEARPFDVGGPTININPLDYEGSARQSIEAHEIAHVGTPTMSYQESEIIRNAMLPMKEPVLSGVQGSKERDASRRALEDFKHLQKPEEAKADLDALRFMMYDKGIYDITKGQKFTESDFEKAKQNLGKDRVFKRLADRMGKKNFVKLMNTIASADSEELPMAMGGMSIPGSVGFTYARTGSTPSNGKYAKKTKASAQIGKNIEKDETNIDTNIASKIAGLELKQNPEYHYHKYLQNQPQLKQAPGRGEELMRQGLGYADVVTDVMQMGNFIPLPQTQTIGKIGNIAGSIVDLTQAAMAAYNKDYQSALINAASAGLPFVIKNPNILGGYNRSAKYAFGNRSSYLPVDKLYGRMTAKQLLGNRALLGILGAETAYDADLIGPVKKEYGGEIPSAQKGKNDIERISINDPRYPEMYKNRQVGLSYDGTISLPALDEVTITAPRSYTMDSLRDFTSAALYGAPATAMKLEAIPQAAMTETIEMLRGRPYDFSNVNPNIGSFSSNQRDLSQTLGYENPEGFLQNAVNLGLSAIDPVIVSGASKVAGKQLAKKAVKAVDLDDVAKRKIHLQKLKDDKLIHPDTDINKYSKSLSDTEELTKKALTQRETYYRGVTPKIPEGPEQQLIIEEMTKAGVDISNPEDVGRYMATHVPFQKLDYNAGFATNDPRYNALYTSGGFSRYGDMTFEMTRPLDFSKGSYSNWLDELYKYPVYNPSEKIDDLSPFTRAYALENRPGPGVFVGTKGQKIFDDARLITDDYGRIKSKPLPGLEDVRINEVPKKQNGGEMKFYQNGLDWKPKSMQNGGDEIYQGLELPEFVVEGKDERMKEAMSQGIRKFYGHVGELMGAPQKEMMQLITGKEQTPSEAWGFQNTGGLFDSYSSFGKNVFNFGLDNFIDPVNAIPGVGLVDDLTRGAVRGAAQDAVSKTLKYGVSPYSYSPEVLAMIPENLVRGALGKPKRFPTIVTESTAKDPNIKRTIEDTFNNREDAWSVYLGLPPENKGLRLVGSDDATGLSKYELTKPRVMNVEDVKNYRKVIDSSTIRRNDQYEKLNLYKPGDTVVDNDKLFGVMGGYSKFVSPDGKNIMYRDVWDLQPFSRLNSRELPTDFLGNAIRNFEASSLIPGAKPFVSEGKLADIRKRYTKAEPYQNIVQRYNDAYQRRLEQMDFDSYNSDEAFLLQRQMDEAVKQGLKNNIRRGDSFLNPLPYNDYKKYADFAPYIKVDKSKKKDGGIIKDNQGYWNPENWGKPVEIDSNDITMEGVYEPLLGVSDTGDTKLMKPGKNYKFKGKKVTEFPVAELGINQLDAQPMKKLNQLLNFTNNPDKDNWLDKYN